MPMVLLKDLLGDVQALISNLTIHMQLTVLWLASLVL